MAVAKSFQSFDFLCEPFYSNGKQYIIVRNPTTGNERTVRWYTDKEYNKLYPSASNSTRSIDELKEVLGFKKDFIYLFKDALYEDEWFKNSIARWHEAWGWYIISTDNVPIDCPLSYEKLSWDDAKVKLTAWRSKS